jgi:hypothetical protein
MDTAVEHHLLSDAMARLAGQPLSQADDDALVSLAHQVWYEHSSMESELRRFLASHPEELAVRRAGYLLERLTRFPCATDDRVRETLQALSLLICGFPRAAEGHEAAQVRLRDRRDELALSWGLNEGLGLKVQTLLPYQTRHYAAARSSAFQ